MSVLSASSRVVVVGAGIIGLACAWAVQRRGLAVTLVDRDFDGDRASHGNAGAIAIGECLPLSLRELGLKPLRWLVDPLGPLAIRPGDAIGLLPWFRALRRASTVEAEHGAATALAAINGQALAAFAGMLTDIGLEHALHRGGALTVYESEAAFEAEQAQWALKRTLGVDWQPVDAQSLRTLEPALSPLLTHGVLEADGAFVDDPREVVTALGQHVRTGGATCVTGNAVALAFDRGADPAVLLDDGRRIAGERLVLAAGAWSGRLARTVGDRVLLASERGYNTTLPASTGRLKHAITFAERRFVATPLAPGLRIGGAAEFAGLAAPANFRRSDALLKLAHRYLPGLDDRGAVRWMGQRPATPDSLPVIGPSPRDRRLLHAFGHGHLGLTQSAATGELIADFVTGSRPQIDPRPYSIGRFVTRPSPPTP